MILVSYVAMLWRSIVMLFLFNFQVPVLGTKANEVKILYTVNSKLPYNMEYDYRFIKPIRHARNKTLAEFSHFMDVDPATIGRLERSQLDFTPYYHSKLKDAINRLRISNIELVSIRNIIEQKEKRGYYK